MEVKKQLLSPATQEFAYLEYGLQLALQSTTARVISAHIISNPHVGMQFEKRCKNIMVLNSWINVSHLEGANTEDEVIRRGFQFTSTSQGMVFPVGVIKGSNKSDNSTDLPPNSSKSASGPKKILLCKVGVGRAKVVDEATAEKCPIPDGYDSFHIERASATSATKNDQIEPYYNQYMIKNSAQALPAYLIQYSFDPSKETASREKAKCDNCETEAATLFCSADSANLCAKCDVQLHSTKLASRHIRTPIDKSVKMFGVCRHHRDKTVEYFCALCHIPVCVLCKMVGNHANGEAARHQLVSITDAYQAVVQEAKAVDPILQTRRSDITNQLSAINHRVKAVEKMSASLESQIDEIYKKALSSLRIFVKEKLDILHGDEVELHRQMNEIDFMENFLEYQKMGDATQFLFSWSRHQQYRAELHDFKFFRNQIDVELDLKVSGEINVGVEEIHSPMTTSAPSSPVKPPVVPVVVNSNVMVGGGLAGIGLGVPKQNFERRTFRRTSDFFAETLSIAPSASWASHQDFDTSDHNSAYDDDFRFH